MRHRVYSLTEGRQLLLEVTVGPSVTDLTKYILVLLS